MRGRHVFDGALRSTEPRDAIDPRVRPASNRPVVGEYPDHLVSIGRFKVSNNSSHRSNSAIRGVSEGG